MATQPTLPEFKIPITVMLGALDALHRQFPVFDAKDVHQRQQAGAWLKAEVERRMALRRGA